MAQTTRWILASALLACGFDGGTTNVVPIDASSDESGEAPLVCGELECDEDEVCVEDEAASTEAAATHRCVSIAGCTVMPADCSCIEPVCGEGRECVGLGLVPGQMFRCERAESP